MRRKKARTLSRGPRFHIFFYQSFLKPSQVSASSEDERQQGGVGRRYRAEAGDNRHGSLQQIRHIGVEVICRDEQADVSRGNLHGRIGAAHQEHQHGQASVWHGNHRHGKTHSHDGLGAADDGTEEKDQGKGYDRRHRQGGKCLRKQVDRSGVNQNIFKGHDQDRVDNQHRLKGGDKHGRHLGRLKLIHEIVNSDADWGCHIDRHIEN